MPHQRKAPSPETVLRELVSLPTAPFHEERVAAWIIRFARRHGLRWRMDATGNVIVTTRPAARSRAPVVFMAHMDHPGFSVRRVRGTTVDLEILGGAPRVPAGARVTLYGLSGGPFTAFATAPERERAGRRSVRVRLQRPLPTGSAPLTFGMWDLTPYRRTGPRIVSRALDDVAGCAAILLALARIAAGRRPVPATALFTRAEEVGFVGASAAIRTRGRTPSIPERSVVISVETSRWRSAARIGDGPVVRLGDRSGLFDPDATTALLRVAEGLSGRDRSFRHQRDLLDGGSCEATALRLAGFRTAGLACPLGNYHNHALDRRGGRAGPGTAPEFIDFRDWLGLAILIQDAAANLTREQDRLGRIRRRVESTYRRYRGRL